MQVSAYGISSKRFERGLASDEARSPIELRIPAAQGTEDDMSETVRKRRSQALLHSEQFVATVADEILVAAVSRKRDGNMLARQTTDSVCWNCRTIRIGLIVDPNKLIEEIVMRCFYDFTTMIRPFCSSNHRCVSRLVIARLSEAYRASKN